MSTVEKQTVVKEVAETIGEAKSVFLTDFTGLNVQEVSELRRAFKQQSVKYRVVKNTLARLSAKEAGYEELLTFLEGPTGMAFGMEDPGAPAKVIKQFTKNKDKLKVKACLFEGVLVGAEQLGNLATLPSRDELLAQLLGTLNAPLSNLVFSLNGIICKLVYTLNAVKAQKEENNQV
jgi:large subunit ribosomal protein L10